jgi:hypothetical protein
VIPNDTRAFYAAAPILKNAKHASQFSRTDCSLEYLAKRIEEAVRGEVGAQPILRQTAGSVTFQDTEGEEWTCDIPSTQAKIRATRYCKTCRHDHKIATLDATLLTAPDMRDSQGALLLGYFDEESPFLIHACYSGPNALDNAITLLNAADPEGKKGCVMPFLTKQFASMSSKEYPVVVAEALAD